MAKLEDGILYVNLFEYDVISEQFAALIGKSSRDAAKVILPMLFTAITEEELSKYKITAVVKTETVFSL